MEAVACGLIIHVDCSLNSEKGRGRRPWWSARQKGGESEMRLEVEERCGAHLSLRSAIRPTAVGSGKLPEQSPASAPPNAPVSVVGTPNLEEPERHSGSVG
jgi:hypothetical protein